MTHSPVLLLLDCLAVFRLTRLVIEDSITAPLREWAKGRKYADYYTGGIRPQVVKRPRVADFLSCPWCVSMWCAGAVVALQATLPRVCLIVCAVLAFSAVAGLIAERA